MMRTPDSSTTADQAAPATGRAADGGLVAPAEAELSPVEAAVFDLLRALAGERAYAHEVALAYARARSDEEEERVRAKRELRRLHSQSSLARVLEFLADDRVLAFYPDAREQGLSGGLIQLYEALSDLGAGRAPELLRPTGKEKSASKVEATFKGRVAAMAELLHRAGDTLPMAAERVAARLRKERIVKPRGAAGSHTAEPITGATVRQWRKEARNGRKHSETALTYDRLVANATMRATSRAALRQLAAAIGHGIAQDRNPKPNLRVE
jgi:hypothetical protein